MRRLHVDILDNGVLTEACERQSSDQPLVLALSRLTVDEQCEALLEGQRCAVRPSLLFIEGLCHSVEPERNEAVVGRMCISCRQWSVPRMSPCRIGDLSGGFTLPMAAVPASSGSISILSSVHCANAALAAWPHASTCGRRGGHGFTAVADGQGLTRETSVLEKAGVEFIPGRRCKGAAGETEEEIAARAPAAESSA